MNYCSLLKCFCCCLNIMYRTSQSDSFKPQNIGGFCEVDSNALSEDGKYRMELTSW